MISNAQQEFDKLYITGSEICEKLGVTRTSLFSARSRGILPEPIIIHGSKTHIWIRADVEANLKKWDFALEVRRGNFKDGKNVSAV